MITITAGSKTSLTYLEGSQTMMLHDKNIEVKEYGFEKSGPVIGCGLIDYCHT
jgi:hypothetical protein